MNLDSEQDLTCISKRTCRVLDRAGEEREEVEDHVTKAVSGQLSSVRVKTIHRELGSPYPLLRAFYVSIYRSIYLSIYLYRSIYLHLYEAGRTCSVLDRAGEEREEVEDQVRRVRGWLRRGNFAHLSSHPRFYAEDF